MDAYAGFALHAARAASKARGSAPVPVVLAVPKAPATYLTMNGGQFA